MAMVLKNGGDSGFSGSSRMVSIARLTA